MGFSKNFWNKATSNFSQRPSHLKDGLIYLPSTLCAFTKHHDELFLTLSR